MLITTVFSYCLLSFFARQPPKASVFIKMFRKEHIKKAWESVLVTRPTIQGLRIAQAVSRATQKSTLSVVPLCNTTHRSHLLLLRFYRFSKSCEVLNRRNKASSKRFQYMSCYPPACPNRTSAVNNVAKIILFFEYV